MKLLALRKEPWRFKDFEDQLNFSIISRAKQISGIRSLQRWMERCQANKMMENKIK
jgi:hypothetical protein